MRRIFLLFTVAWVCTFTLFAQKGTLKGSITDEKTKEALIGSTILLKGTTLGTVTNQDGEFTINNVEPGKQTVLASLLGYNPI